MLTLGTGVTGALAVPMSDQVQTSGGNRRHRFQGTKRETKQQRGLGLRLRGRALALLCPRAWVQASGRDGGRAEKNRSEAHHSDREMGDSIRGLGKSEGPY